MANWRGIWGGMGVMTVKLSFFRNMAAGWPSKGRVLLFDCGEGSWNDPSDNFQVDGTQDSLTVESQSGGCLRKRATSNADKEGEPGDKDLFIGVCNFEG
jgi:hypothetical protein